MSVTAVNHFTILTDDLSRPAKGKAKVRVIQASIAYDVLDVSLANGTPIASVSSSPLSLSMT